MGLLRQEDFFDGLAEELRDRESQWQARVIFARFDGIDGLSRYLELVRELTLAPATVGAQLTDQVFHLATRQRRPATRPQVRPISPHTQNMLSFGKPAPSRKPYVNVTPAVTAPAMAKLSRLRSRMNSSMRPKCRAIAQMASSNGIAGDISSSVRAPPGSMGLPRWIEPNRTAMYASMAAPSSSRYFLFASRSSI